MIGVEGIPSARVSRAGQECIQGYTILSVKVNIFPHIPNMEDKISGYHVDG